MPQLGVLEVWALGEQRFRIVERRVQRDGLSVGSLELLPHDADAPIPESCTGCVKLLERVIEQQGGLFQPPHRLDSSSWVSSRLAEILPLPLPAKQELLELSDARVRIERLNALLRPPAEGV
jgi:Lon protease-like protein